MSPMKMQGINSKMATTMPSRSNRRDDGGSEEKEEEEKLVEVGGSSMFTNSGACHCFMLIVWDASHSSFGFRLTG